MIYIEDLIKEDIGRYVIYTDGLKNEEQGRLKSWNDKWIFVVYHCADDWDNYQDYTGAATDPNDLKFVEPKPGENWKTEDKLNRFDILDL